MRTRFRELGVSAEGLGKGMGEDESVDGGGFGGRGSIEIERFGVGWGVDETVGGGRDRSGSHDEADRSVEESEGKEPGCSAEEGAFG